MKLLTKISTISLALLFLTANTVSASIPKTVKVSDNDTTAGYLNGKLVAGTGVSFTEGSDGGDETLTISATGSGAVDISADTNLAVSGTLATLTGDTISIKEGTLTNGKYCTYVTGTGLVCTADSSGGATTFLGLTDTPSSYSGQNGKYVRVNSGETSLEFATPSGSGDMTKAVYDPDDNGTIDISSNTNLAAGRSLTLSGDSVEADTELYTDWKGFTIETPTDADNFFICEVPIAITVIRVTGIVESATSAVLTLQNCDAAGDNCVTVESVTADVDGTISTSIDSPNIAAGHILRVDVGTVTGTVGQAHLTFTYTKND